MDEKMRRTAVVIAVGLGVAGAARGTASAATVNIAAGNVSALKSALAGAHPGDTLVLNGTYNLGTSGLVTSVDGAAGAPITLMAGSGGATLAGGSGGSGIGINNDYYYVQGLKITGFQKSVRIDNASHGVLVGLTCSGSTGEAIKLRDTSQYWLVAQCTASNTGAEGFYAGDADQNWVGGVADKTGYITFYQDTAIATTNDGFDCKEGTHDIKIIDCAADWQNTVPGANSLGNSGIYDRATRLQVIGFDARNNGSTGDVIRANRTTALDGVTYGSGTEIFDVSGENMRGYFLYSNHLDTVLYPNYSTSDIDGGLLEPGSRTPKTGGAWISEMTWAGEGGGRFYAPVVPEAKAWWGAALMPLRRRRRRAALHG